MLLAVELVHDVLTFCVPHGVMVCSKGEKKERVTESPTGTGGQREELGTYGGQAAWQVTEALTCIWQVPGLLTRQQVRANITY